MNPRAEDQATIRLVVYNRRVTPISYCYDCLVVDWHGGHLRTFTGRGRGFNRGHATFAWALGSSLLGGLLVKCFVVAPLASEFLGCYGACKSAPRSVVADRCPTIEAED
jgi:hypothetical protein